ncbi:MAG: Hsp20/alpha crystallin family protein [Chloracidobacterium sp.]|nr:Hsp20/alpha crystallin family protein [Chloracidobacterium sp.]
MKSEEKKDDEKLFLNEWRSNRFCRQMRLPSEVETENVTAQLKDGILHLSLKKKAAEEAAKIAVTAA